LLSVWRRRCALDDQIDLFGMPTDMTERTRRPVHDAHQSTWSVLDPLLATSGVLCPAGVKAKCTALQRVIGMEQLWAPFDGGQDGITLDPNGYAPQSHALMPCSMQRTAKFSLRASNPSKRGPEPLQDDQPVGRPLPSLLRTAHATGGHIMIDTPQQDKGV